MELLSTVKQVLMISSIKSDLSKTELILIFKNYFLAVLQYLRRIYVETEKNFGVG